MNFNKKEFLKTDLGINLIGLMTSWRGAFETINICNKCGLHGDDYYSAKETVAWCKGQFNVYKILLKQFYNVDAHFVCVESFCEISLYIDWFDYSDILLEIRRHAK